MTPPEPEMNVKKIPCLQRSYWDRSTLFADKGDVNVDIVYAAVGRALTQWEKLEQRLANLFLVVCNAPNCSASPERRAYGAVENGTLRRKAIQAAAEVHFGTAWDVPIVQKSFNCLIERVSDASKRRDDIAHGIVQHFVIDRTDYGAFLFPPFYNTARTSPYLTDEGGPPDFRWSDFRFTAQNIDKFERRFGELKQVISDYVILCARRDDGLIPFVEAVCGDGVR